MSSPEQKRMQQLSEQGTLRYPRYLSMADNVFRQVMSPGRVAQLDEASISFTLEVVPEAALLEEKVLNLLEKFQEAGHPEFFWVYTKGIPETAKAIQGLPDSSREYMQVGQYLEMVDVAIAKFVVRHISPEIHEEANIRSITRSASVKKFFNLYRPSDERWEIYIFLAEYLWTIDNGTDAEFTPFRIDPKILVFSSLFKSGYKGNMIREGYESAREKQKNVIPRAGWSGRQYEVAMQAIIWEIELNTPNERAGHRVRANQQRNRTKPKKKSSAKCYNCGKEGHFKAKCPV